MAGYAASRNKMERTGVTETPEKLRHLEPDHVAGLLKSRCDGHLSKCRNGTKEECDEYLTKCRNVIENVAPINANVSDLNGGHATTPAEHLANSEQHHLANFDSWNTSHSTAYNNHSEALSIEENFPQHINVPGQPEPVTIEDMIKNGKPQAYHSMGFVEHNAQKSAQLSFNESKTNLHPDEVASPLPVSAEKFVSKEDYFVTAYRNPKVGDLGTRLGELGSRVGRYHHSEDQYNSATSRDGVAKDGPTTQSAQDDLSSKAHSVDNPHEDMDLRLDFHDATSARGEVAEELADFHSLVKHSSREDFLVDYFYAPTHALRSGGDVTEQNTRKPAGFTPRIPYYDDIHKNTSSIRAVGSPEAFGMEPAFVVEPVATLGVYRVEPEERDPHNNKEEHFEPLLPYMKSRSNSTKNSTDSDTAVSTEDTAKLKKVTNELKKRPKMENPLSTSTNNESRKAATKTKKVKDDGKELVPKKIRNYYKPIGKPSSVSKKQSSSNDFLSRREIIARILRKTVRRLLA